MILGPMLISCWGSWGHLGAISGPSWVILGHLRPTWDYLGTTLGQLAFPPEPVKPEIRPLEPILARLGASWGQAGAILGYLDPSWGHIRAILGPSWGHLGASWDHLGAMLGQLEPPPEPVKPQDRLN